MIFMPQAGAEPASSAASVILFICFVLPEPTCCPPSFNYRLVHLHLLHSKNDLKYRLTMVTILHVIHTATNIIGIVVKDTAITFFVTGRTDYCVLDETQRCNNNWHNDVTSPSLRHLKRPETSLLKFLFHLAFHPFIHSIQL